jgi:serine/threonine protein kinase
MPIKFGTGEKIRSAIDTYTVEDVLSQGAFAHAARATSSIRGEKVFLKRYFSPTRALDWYEGFVQHQQELKRRITSNTALSQYSYGFIDFFEGTEGRSSKTFHQVFEFVKDGKPLTRFLSELAPSGPTAQWERRVSFARVMMMGIAALHAQRIVHTDLKPDNILLVPNRVRPDTYNLKLIDLDWSIFSDRQAPWHGKGVGYVGTHGYMSPEHLRGDVPEEHSDTYTCAIMLSELLAGAHPFSGKLADEAMLKSAMLNGGFKRFSLPAAINKVDDPRALETLVNRALSPSATERPTSTELKNALFGRSGFSEEPGSSADAARPPVARPAPASGTGPSTHSTVDLLLHKHVALRINIDTVVGRQMLKSLHDDAQFLADAQFRIHRTAGGGWAISPLPGTINETLLDGQKLDTTTALKEGMRIAVGNSAKHVEKLPLLVRMR